MCQCGDFYQGEIRVYGGLYIGLGVSRKAPVFCRICLGCGFIVPHLDGSGLMAIREKAKWPWDETRGRSNKEELREL
jgi:hypothetical protein